MPTETTPTNGPNDRPGLSPSERAGWARTYEETNYSKLPWFSPRPSPFLVRAVAARWLPRRDRVLDIGCGAGTNVLWLARRGFRATGVDVAPAAIRVARSRSSASGTSATFELGEATRLPFPRARFGTTLDFGCFHTLPFHLREPYAEEVARVLRPGGSFLLSWIGREETRRYGPAHRPSLAEVTNVFESRFLFSSVEFHGSNHRGAWVTPGGALALYAAHLVRRRSPQPKAR
jgi:SAM-dependent methyltransferase